MTEDFLFNLRLNLSKKPALSKREKKMLKWLDEPPSKERDRHLSKLEQRARKKIGVAAGVRVDWSAKTIDWNSIIQELLAMLLKLLPFLFA